MRNVKITMKAFFILKKGNALSPNAKYIIVDGKGKQIAIGKNVSPFIIYVKGEPMTNKYRGLCYECKRNVPAGTGTATKPQGKHFWQVHCSTHSTVSNVYYFPSTGTTLYRNKNGRCEDAPCCGCCTV